MIKYYVECREYQPYLCECEYPSSCCPRGPLERDTRIEGVEITGVGLNGHPTGPCNVFTGSIDANVPGSGYSTVVYSYKPEFTFDTEKAAKAFASKYRKFKV